MRLGDYIKQLHAHWLLIDNETLFRSKECFFLERVECYIVNQDIYLGHNRSLVCLHCDIYTCISTGI